MTNSTDSSPVNESLLKSGYIEVQKPLESGVTIKTVNNTSVLGSGNIQVQPVIDDLSTIRSGAALGATAVQPSKLGTDISSVPSQTVTNYVSERIGNIEEATVKSYVDTQISTNSANFEGAWDTWDKIPPTVKGFKDEGYEEPANNDYLMVREYRKNTDDELTTWRFKYVDPITGDTYGTYNKSKWVAEYPVNSSAFTEAQLNAINSGITEEKVTKVIQNVSTGDGTYPILLTPTANASADQGAQATIFASGVKVNPSTSTVQATAFVGNLTGDVTGNSGTTTKLKTTRSINGTNFDGSANITTNIWGTSRNIQIADSSGENKGAASSVNGSANVELKLPSTIKATFVGNVTGNVTGDVTSTKGEFSSNTVGSALKVTNTTASDTSAIQFVTGTEGKGLIGVNKDKKPVFQENTDGTAQSLIRGTLSTAMGATNKGVYIDANGIVQPCTYEVNKTVPEGAVFTDTNTLVVQNKSTAAANYPILLTPVANANANQGAKETIFSSGVKVNPSNGVLILQPVTTSSSPEGGELEFQVNAASTSYAGIRIESNDSTFKISGIDSANGTSKVNSTPLVIDPYGRTVSGSGNTYTFTGNLSGNATTATKLGNSAVGGTTTPIYLDAGVPKPLSYTIAKSVPSNAVFTDTKNTAGSTNTSSKLFLIGATSQAANPQTYSHDTVFVDTAGRLNSAAPATDANDNTVATTAWTNSKVSTSVSEAVSAAVPAGTVIWYSKNSNPSGYLYCNGAAVSRTTYADLFAVIGTTFGAGDGATTFNIPNLVNRYVKGSGTVGTALAAGLPSIGASKFIKSVTTHNADGSPSGSEAMSFIRTASSQNVASVYGSATTVQPPSLTLRPLIKY